MIMNVDSDKLKEIHDSISILRDFDGIKNSIDHIDHLDDGETVESCIDSAIWKLTTKTINIGYLINELVKIRTL